eukprot:3371310-Pleurochrysis_carterae.AAC.1
MTDCSSCWEGLGTLENRLLSATCCHWPCCPSLSMKKWLHNAYLGRFRCCGRQSITHVAVYNAVYFSRGPSMESKLS